LSATYEDWVRTVDNESIEMCKDAVLEKMV